VNFAVRRALIGTTPFGTDGYVSTETSPDSKLATRARVKKKKKNVREGAVFQRRVPTGCVERQREKRNKQENKASPFKKSRKQGKKRRTQKKNLDPPIRKE